MQVRLLRGTFGSDEGFAINDFETLSTGDITDEFYQLAGTDQNGGCVWDQTHWGIQ